MNDVGPGSLTVGGGGWGGVGFGLRGLQGGGRGGGGGGVIVLSAGVWQVFGGGLQPIDLMLIQELIKYRCRTSKRHPADP